MKPAKPIVDLKGVSSSGAKGASRQQSILTRKATSATPANIWRGMIPMLAKKMSAIGSLLLDPQVPLGGGGQTVTSGTREEAYGRKPDDRPGEELS